MVEPAAAPPVEPPVAPVEPPATPPETPPVAPEVYFGGDGSLKEGWNTTLEEGLRDEKSLATFKTVNDLAKSFVNTKSMVGKDTIAVPGDTSTEPEWEAYYKAGGRPETAADYNLKAPDGFPEEVLEQVFPKARLDAWQERLFKGGVSKKAADKFIADFAQDVLLDLQSAKQTEEQQMDKLKKGLSDEYGAAMAQKTHIGNIAIEEGTRGDLEFKARLTDKFGNDPDFIRYSVNLGEKFTEGKSPDLINIPTPADYQTQIDAIIENPLYLGGTREQRMKLAEQVMALRKLQKPETTA